LRVAELESLHQRLEARRKYLQQRGSVFTADPGIHEIIHEVALAGSRAGLEITRLEPLSPSTAASFQTLPFRLSFRGRYHACMQFVHALELQSRLMRIEDLRLISESGKNGSVVQGELNFAVYAKRAEKRDVAEKRESAGAARSDKEFR
jgi:Tfp pilus assembly protein PilO